MEQTYIKGKDACLEASINTMQALLKEGGFEIDEVSWLNPASNVYSVHIRDKFCSALFTNGKGASRKACLASALGEFLERLQTNYFFSDYFLTPSAQGKEKDQAWSFLYYPNEKAFSVSELNELLSEDLHAFYDPESSLEPQDFFSLNDHHSQIRAIPMVRVSDQRTVYFPMNVLSNFYASNGLCAGNTFQEAHVQGLSELFERWVKRRILTENLCLPEVPEDVLNQYPNVAEALRSLKSQGLEVSVRDASLGGQFPVMNVTLFDPAAGCCFASFGAHPYFEVALERTLTESLQGRSLDNLDGFQIPSFDKSLVADDENIENHFIDSSGLIHARFISHQADYEFHAWDFEGDTQAQYHYLVDLIHQQGFEIYYADYDHYGMPASRLVVPGMSEVFSRHELVDNNQNFGRILREALFRLEAEPSESEFESVLDVIEALGFADHQGVANLIGLLADANSEWADFKVVDLALGCHLALQDYESALYRLNEAFPYVKHQDKRHFYYALQYALEGILSHSEDLLTESVMGDLFGKPTVDKVWQHLRGEAFFGGLEVGRSAFEHSVPHQRLMAVYERVQKQKCLHESS